MFALPDVHPGHGRQDERGIAEQEATVARSDLANKTIRCEDRERAQAPDDQNENQIHPQAEHGRKRVDGDRHPKPERRIGLDDVSIEMRAFVKVASNPQLPTHV
ncbi:MAG: hypothetical protein ACTHOI_11880 [Sphingomicrobium sp.]